MLSHKWHLPSVEGIPQVPDDLTSKSDRELMDLFSQFVAWQNYIDQMSVDYERVEAQQASKLKMAEAKALAKSEAKQVAQKKAEAADDVEVQKAEEAFITAKYQRKALGIQKDALERTTNLISRELSRRIGREPVQRRQERFRP